ncbi:fungal zn(2)-cys(6) binuclear cluster domain protein, putative [Rhizoctonia solani AG-3 Rhs1AP]|uniref:Fungal zn(2)-cys(6) binuclear cluster domain protein, putative n=1 Tax=Rhizoctonia solani AG-3 Rhs1AP TaxID=1086054 RepID=X8JJA1_9AGAM|nr:fungal zn(2)-cys(6) binuclear cluster domain protein, putative [Rhizoctonia solani AG-3 Rhs1AP]
MTKIRSTTGCTTCKRKRRKCDEGKPKCQRCVSTGNPCCYEFRPNTMPHLIQRTKPAPRPLSESVKGPRDTIASLEPPPFSEPSDFVDSTISSDFITATTLGDELNHDFNLATPPGCTVDPLDLSSIPLPLDSYLYQSITLDFVPLTEITHGFAAPALGTGLEGSTQLDDGEVEDHDPEGIHAVLCISPTMDRNLKENSMPFVLQSYSQWAIVSIFEPLKIAHTMRDHVIAQFASEDTRTRTILIANVMRMFAENPLVDSTGTSIVSYLASKVQEDVWSFMATPPSSVIALDKRNAMRVLDHTLEIMTLQINTRSLAACIQSVVDAAPVFRRACSEPTGQPLNLANMLLDPGLNLRHFVSADLLTSVTTGRPTCFKYEITFSAELCERMFQLQENCGLHWLHGLPDQFIMIFAWINSLCELQGARVDANLVARIEKEIIQAKIALDQAEDPSLRIGRTIVREGWRHATLIYLYMVLCQADANDSRVVRALKNFMRLINGIKPGRIPDTYLANPMIIAGVAACKERDRRTIRQRILSVPECSVPETAGYDAVLELEDVWARTRNEGRAAVWSDLRIACFVVTGM